MLFTWDTNNLCIVFSSWRITSFWSLILSLVAVMALTAGYEAVREASRRYEARQNAILSNAPSKSTTESQALLMIVKPMCSFLQRSAFGTQLTTGTRDVTCHAGAAWSICQSSFLWRASLLLVFHYVSYSSA